MVRLVQNSFHGGQLDFEMMGRQDYQRYAKGATLLRNFNIVQKGAIEKRRGFDRLLDLTKAGFLLEDRVRAIPFAYKKSHGFVLLMSANRCVVVGTAPTYKFKYYSITGLDGVYDADAIQELDYQQCGDVLFLAQQDTPPAKITHSIDEASGEHSFDFEFLDFSSDKKISIPSIVASHVDRMKVSDYYDSTKKAGGASMFTEKYKVTAVFDGVETFPCSEYYAEAVASKIFSKTTDEDTGYWAAGWDGTNYPRPWTDSQTITLTLRPYVRVDEDGDVQFPEEIRVYRKAFNYYGLVGTVKVKSGANDATYPTLLTKGFSGATAKNSDGTSVDVLLKNGSADVASHGSGLVGYEVNASRTIIYTSSVIPTGNIVRVVVHVGCCTYTVSDDNDYVVFDFNAKSSASKIIFSLCNYDGTVAYYSNSMALPTNFQDRTTTVRREDGESDDDFSTRWRARYSTFVNSIKCDNSVSAVFTNVPSAFKYMSISCNVGTVFVSAIRMSYYSSAVGDVTFKDNYITPDTSITPPEEDEDNPMFEGDGNYPASVALSQQRLIWASSKNDPARVWASEVGDFYNYCNHEIQVTSDPIDFKLPVTRFAKINHICEMRKLLMFNSACEWLIDSSSSNSGITYETIQAYPQSYSGSSERLKPIICNNSLIFCERTGQRVRRFAYDLSNDGFAGRDVSIVSASIFDSNNIVDWTYQQFPFSILWCVLHDGSLASFEFMEEQDIMAWATHSLGGGGLVESVATSYAVSPALDMVMDVDSYENATHEEIFAVVRRQGSLWLERMRVRSRTLRREEVSVTDSVYHSLCLDGMRVLNSADPTPTDEDGAIWIPADTTDGAAISKEEAVRKIDEGVDVYEGFPFDATYTSVYPFIQGGIGNGQFDVKHIQGIGLRLAPSYGGVVIPVGAKDAEPLCYYYNDPENDHRPVFGGGNLTMFCHSTNLMSLPGVNTRDGRVTVMQSDPYPFELLSYEIDFETES